MDVCGITTVDLCQICPEKSPGRLLPASKISRCEQALVYTCSVQLYILRVNQVSGRQFREVCVMSQSTRLLAAAIVTGAAAMTSSTAGAFFGMGDWFDGPGWGGYPGYGWGGYPGYGWGGYPGYGWGGYPGYGYGGYPGYGWGGYPGYGYGGYPGYGWGGYPGYGYGGYAPYSYAPAAPASSTSE